MKRYLDGLKFGMILQLAVGPMSLMVFNTAGNAGFVVALILVLAIALVDAFYIVLASLGVSKILNKSNIKNIFKIISSIVLVIFGIIAWPTLAVLLTLPVAIKNIKAMNSGQKPQDIATLDGDSAKLVLLFSMLLVIANVVSSFI